ncbi:MAG TPA: alpha/beta hydrolase [Polyangiaceae bacterium]|nr:alpha/beta hydrolase [Polyangiaceae bacterium]
MRAVHLAVVLAVLSPGCKSKEAPPKPQAAAVPSALPSAAAPEAPRAPPSKAEEITFDAPDGASLAGTLFLASDPAAPIAVFVHRFRGDRKEWTKVTERLASSEKRYTLLTFDLRGHGDSRSGAGKKRLDWADMKAKDVPGLVEDVHAAMAAARKRTEGKSTRVVLVGSSLGAALAARAASQDPNVVAIAMVSPGAAIEGYDVYHPFADVRTLPSFLVAAKDDNVSKDPMDGLSRMAKDLATVKLYEGRGHAASGLLQEGDPLDQDLEKWLEGVFDKEPIQRELSPRGGAKKTSQKG